MSSLFLVQQQNCLTCARDLQCHLDLILHYSLFLKPIISGHHTKNAFTSEHPLDCKHYLSSAATLTFLWVLGWFCLGISVCVLGFFCLLFGCFGWFWFCFNQRTINLKDDSHYRSDSKEPSYTAPKSIGIALTTV